MLFMYESLSRSGFMIIVPEPKFIERTSFGTIILLSRYPLSSFISMIRHSGSDSFIKKLVSTIKRMLGRLSWIRLDIMTRWVRLCQDAFCLLQDTFSKCRLNEPNSKVPRLIGDI